MSNKDATIFEIEIGGKKVTFETGKYCEQSSGSCLVRCGETAVMVNVNMSPAPRPGIDFFPLSVDFEEKMYAVGKIPGGFKKREGRASDKAILTSRLIDRPLRPLFPKGFYNDVTVVATALSVDPNIAPEPLAMLGSSFALSISDIPFMGPTGSVCVGLVDGKYVINPDLEQREKSLMHLMLSGTEEAILMVEAGAKEVTEEQMLDGIMFGHEEIKKIVRFIKDVKAKIGKPVNDKIVYETVEEEINTAVREFATPLIVKALDEFDREKRQKNQEEANEQIYAHFAEIYPEQTKQIGDVIYKITKETVRSKIINEGVRPDGRKTTEIRPIWCDVGVLPRVHGTGVFTRGQTQVLTTLTLGTISDMQKLEGLDEEDCKRYMHHYNMPGYATGEAKPLKSPGRREIGHGALAERQWSPCRLAIACRPQIRLWRRVRSRFPRSMRPEWRAGGRFRRSYSARASRRHQLCHRSCRRSGTVGEHQTGWGKFHRSGVPDCPTLRRVRCTARASGRCGMPVRRRPSVPRDWYASPCSILWSHRPSVSGFGGRPRPAPVYGQV